MLRTPVNEWLDPMKEAPSVEGAFLVSETPPSGRQKGRGTGDGGVIAGPDGSPTNRTSDSSAATPNSAWDYGR